MHVAPRAPAIAVPAPHSWQTNLINHNQTENTYLMVNSQHDSTCLLAHDRTSMHSSYSVRTHQNPSESIRIHTTAACLWVRLTRKGGKKKGRKKEGGRCRLSLGLALGLVQMLRHIEAPWSASASHAHNYKLKLARRRRIYLSICSRDHGVIHTITAKQVEPSNLTSRASGSAPIGSAPVRRGVDG